MRTILYPKPIASRLSMANYRRLVALAKKANVSESEWIRTTIAPFLEKEKA